MTEPQKIQQLFKELIKSDLYLFPKKGNLDISCKHGVYIIYTPSGIVSHVGNTRTGANGLCQRLNNHISRKSSYGKKYLKPRDLSVGNGFTYRFIEVPVARRRVLLEALACGKLCPEHLGTHEKT